MRLCTMFVDLLYSFAITFCGLYCVCVTEQMIKMRELRNYSVQLKIKKAGRLKQAKVGVMKEKER